jgi:hypothetical protein
MLFKTIAQGGLPLRALVVVPLALLLTCGAAFAQEITGQIYGKVTDVQGLGVPGATVTVTSPNHIKAEVRTTSELGTYRVLRLHPSSNYTVMVELTGFQTATYTEIILRAGMIIAVDATLSPSGVEESVTVVGTSPLVDIKSSQAMRTLERERLENIPLGRDYDDLLTSMAGIIDTEYQFAPAQSVLGSDPRGNLYLIDGAVANDTTVGYILTEIPIDMIEEVQVTTGGATAEFGNSNGGVFNFVTKSGGNEFSGSGYYYYQGEGTEWSNITPELERELGAKSSIIKDTDVGATLGGPIKKDAVWFFGNARYLDKSFLSPLIPDQPDETTQRQGFFKVTGQIGDNTRAFGSATLRQQNRFPSNVTDFSRAADPLVWDSQIRKQKIWNLGLTHLVGTDTIVDLRWNRQQKEFIHNQPNNPDATVGFRDVATGLFSGGLTRRPDHPTCRCSWGAGANVLYFRENAAGSHELKAGFYMDRPNSEKFFAFPNGEDIDQQLFDGEPFRVVLQNLPRVQRSGINRYALFAQDQWTIGDRLTLNLGVRWENTEGWLPETSTGGGRWFPAVTFPETRDAVNWNTVAPRIGVVYALGEAKRTSLKAYYGRHYRSMLTGILGPLSPSSGGSETYEWNDLNGNGTFQDGEQGTLIGSGFDPRRLDPEFGKRVDRQRDLTNSYVDSFHFTVEHELNPSTVVSVGASFKRDKNIIETIRVRERGDQENPFNDYRELQVENQWDQTPFTIYALRPEFLGDRTTQIITNPSFASTGPLFRDYDGVEFRVHRRFRDGWQLMASYNLSEAYGNIANDYAGTSSTNVIYENPNATIVHNLGPLVLDAPHQFKLQGTYTLPAEVLVSGFFQAVSGYTEQIKKQSSSLRLGQGNYVGQYFPLCPGTGATKGDGGGGGGCRTAETGGVEGIVVESLIQIPLQARGTFRHDFRTKLDLRVEKQFQFGDTYRLGLILDMFNVTNINRVTAYQSLWLGIPQFLKPSDIELPRVVRLGIRFNF